MSGSALDVFADYIRMLFHLLYTNEMLERCRRNNVIQILMDLLGILDTYCNRFLSGKSSILCITGISGESGDRTGSRRCVSSNHPGAGSKYNPEQENAY